MNILIGNLRNVQIIIASIGILVGVIYLTTGMCIVMKSDWVLLIDYHIKPLLKRLK